MHWNWRDEGFRARPQAVPAPPALRLYRAWGGASQKFGSPSRPGVCFSTQVPRTRSEAERLFSAWEWGNSCLWLTEFSVLGRPTLHVGAVDPGGIVDSRLFDPRTGVQVFIDNPLHGKLYEIKTIRLLDDLHGLQVHPGSRLTQ